MKIYAVSWVMGSPVDSHVKEIFACNPHLNLAGFIFPEVRVPELEGVPIYDYSNAPIDRKARYIDFSMAQRLDPVAQAWCAQSGVNVLSLSQFMLSLTLPQSELRTECRLEGQLLREIQDFSAPTELLAAVSMPSLQRLLAVATCYRTLNFRALHGLNDGLTIEGFVLRSLENFNRYIRGGRIQVHSYGFDAVAVQLSKVLFTIREFSQLTVRCDDKLTYQLNGRERGNNASTSVHFLTADRVQSAVGEVQSDAHLLIHLRRGLLDLEPTVVWIEGLRHAVKSLVFHQISSRFSDAFLECRLVKKI